MSDSETAPTGTGSILFLCVANAARSQMAEGLARALLPSAVHVASAGSEPGKLDSRAIAVMDEIGISIHNQRSKSVNELDARAFDCIITLCAEEVCPVVTGATPQRLHWPVPDPANSGSDELTAFRNIRDQLRERILTHFS